MKSSRFFLQAIVFTVYSLHSFNVSAFAVWAVESGASANTNSAGSILLVSPGLNELDLYFDTQSDISIGWDVLLSVSGTGTVGNLIGGDINNGLGVSIGDDSYRQLGGNPLVDLSSSSQLLFSLSFFAEQGGSLKLMAPSNFTSGITFTTIGIDDVILAATPVPVPASAWLLLSSMGLLMGARSRCLRLSKLK